MSAATTIIDLLMLALKLADDWRVDMSQLKADLEAHGGELPPERRQEYIDAMRSAVDQL